MVSSATLVSTLSSMLPLPTMTFDPSIVGRPLAFKAYCLNPPPDSCNYGPCPNSDVTGVGQQVSIYVASVMFVIAIVYCQELVRTTLYAHLGLIYSLLIASSASIGRGELTQNDGVFVLVTVASPASFSLWFLTLWSFKHPNVFPVRKSSPKSIELPLLKFLSLGSLVFEIIMIGLILQSPGHSHLNFSQPACDRSFGGKLWIELLWEMPYIVQAGWLVIIISLMGCALKKLPCRVADATSSWGQWETKTQVDVVTWTEISLVKHPTIALPESSQTVSTVLIIIQLCAMPNIGFFINQNLVVLLLLYRAYARDIPFNKDRRFRFFGFTLVLLAGFFFIMNTILSSNFPTSSDSILVWVCLSISWQRFCFPGTVNSVVWRNRILYTAGLVLTLVCSSFAWIITPGGLGTFINGEKSFVAVKPQPLLLNTFMLPFWILAWLATSVWPAGKRLSCSQMWKSTMSRAHILKAGLLVIAPNGMWIQSSIASNTTRSTDMEFGQIVALVLSAVSVAFLVDVARRIDTKVWKAFFNSEPLSPSQDDILPLHSHVVASTSRNPVQPSQST